MTRSLAVPDQIEQAEVGGTLDQSGAEIDLRDPVGPADRRSLPTLVTPSVAVFFPAYNEADNIATTVADAVRVLDQLGGEYQVIVVDDGSRDQTAEVVAAAITAYAPSDVVLARHDVNRGYGAALRTGFDAACASGLDWAFFTDADGQFDMAELVGFLTVAQVTRADLVVGYRVHRADPLVRRVNARMWGWLSNLLVRHGVRDVDCAFKLIRCSVLADLHLTGEAATISPELVAKARRSGARIVELPVSHFPRQHGEPSGARFSVVARSLLDLVGVSVRMGRRKA